MVTCVMVHIVFFSPSVKKEKSSTPAHGTVAMAVILVLLILTAAGIAGYVFYKKRPKLQATTAGFDNSLYHDRVVILHNNDSECPVENFDNMQGK